MIFWCILIHIPNLPTEEKDVQSTKIFFLMCIFPTLVNHLISWVLTARLRRKVMPGHSPPNAAGATSAERSSLMNIKSDVIVLIVLILSANLIALATDTTGGASASFFVSVRTAFVIVAILYKPISIYVRKPEVRAFLLTNVRQRLPVFQTE